MTISELKSRFISIVKIKKGGQKTVYKAVAPDNKTFALKVINNASDQRVLQEIELIKRLSIDNVPAIIENGIVFDESIGENVLFIIEEYIWGISLRDWLNSGNTCNLKMAYNILKFLLNIEICLENNKILHRDINPNNIILGDNGSIYLIDFGLAKDLNGTSYTKTNALHGPFTPGYAPHEQFANVKYKQDVRTDLFQIGVTIYESCTGRNPFVTDNSTMYQVLSRTMTLVPPALSFAEDTNGMFAQLINMLMAKNQSQRPNSASDALRYLSTITPTLLLED